MGTVSPLQTRGERNNNPGNIVFDPNREEQFLGELGLELAQPNAITPRRFARFDTPAHGIRAIARILHSYYIRDGLPTLRGWIERWAPPSDDNDTLAYVVAVASETGIDPDKPFNDGAGPDAGDYSEVTRAIIKHENGRVIYDDQLIADAVGTAFV